MGEKNNLKMTDISFKRKRAAFLWRENKRRHFFGEEINADISWGEKINAGISWGKIKAHLYLVSGALCKPVLDIHSFHRLSFVYQSLTCICPKLWLTFVQVFNVNMSEIWACICPSL